MCHYFRIPSGHNPADMCLHENGQNKNDFGDDPILLFRLAERKYTVMRREIHEIYIPQNGNMTNTIMQPTE